MVQRLLNTYSQQSATSKGRNAVMQTLALLLVRLGPTYVCDNFSEIWEAIRRALLVGSHNKNNERQSRITEDYITFIIGKMVFNHLFHEKEQMATMKYFTERLDGFQVMLDKGVRDMSLFTSINVTLQQIQCLLRAFGQSTVPEISLLEAPLLQLSENAVIDVHSAAQSCLAVYTCTVPSRLQPLILQRIDSLDNYLQTHASNSDAQEIDRATILGQTGIISCLLPLLQCFPLYASSDVCARTVSLASRLLKTSGDRDLATSAMMVRAAWQLLEAILGLTKRYFGVHLPQILLLWRNALPKASNRELAQVEGRTPQDWIFLLLIREAVLRSMSTFLERNSAEAHEGDIMRRLVALLHHAMAFYASIPPLRRQNEDPTRAAELTKMEECQNAFLGSLMRAFTLVGPQQVSEQTRIALCNTCMVQFARFGNRARSTHSGINHVNQTQNIWESNEALPSFLQNDESSELDPAAPSFGKTLSMATKELIIEGLPRRIQRMAEDLSTGDKYEKSILIDSPARLFASLFPTLSSVDQIRLLDSLLKLHQQTSSEAASSRQDRSSSFVSVTLLAILELVARQLVQGRKDSGPVDESVLTLLRDALFVSQPLL